MIWTYQITKSINSDQTQWSAKQKRMLSARSKKWFQLPSLQLRSATKRSEMYKSQVSLQVLNCSMMTFQREMNRKIKTFPVTNWNRKTLLSTEEEETFTFLTHFELFSSIRHCNSHARRSWKTDVFQLSIHRLQKTYFGTNKIRQAVGWYSNTSWSIHFNSM